MKRFFCIMCTLLVLVGGFFGNAIAKKKKKAPKVNYLALASLLIRDGHLRRADSVLAQYNPKKKGAKRDRYYTLRGIIAFKQKDLKKAAFYFEQAIAAGQKEKMIHLFLAQAYFRLASYQKAIRTLKRAPESVTASKNGILIRIQSHWKLGQKVEAYGFVAKGRKLFPQMRSLARLQILLLIELNLFREVIRLGKPFLKAKDVKVTDYLAFSEALRRGRQFKLAIQFLEEALLRFPETHKAQLLLARCYLENRRPFAAAVLLERAAIAKPKFMVEAAELFRRARKFWRAFHINARVKNQKAKIKQRLGLLIELKRYEQAAAMRDRLSRLGLLKDQNIVYAMAYAYYKTGRYQTAERWLKRIRHPKLFQKAIVLRQAMQSCIQKSDQWWCP